MLEVIWLGHSCFWLKGRDVTLLTDPFHPSLGYPLGKPSANIVTISHRHPHHDYLLAIGGQPKVIDGPGEYEIGGVFITGIQTYRDSEGGKPKGKNTIYVIEIDDLVVCHLGDLAHLPTTEQVEQMGSIDLLLVPVGGNGTLNASQASEVISLLEPKLAVPMHYKTEAVRLDLGPVDRFCRQMGLKNPTPQARLVVNRNSLPSQPQVVLLQYHKS